MNKIAISLLVYFFINTVLFASNDFVLIKDLKDNKQIISCCDTMGFTFTNITSLAIIKRPISVATTTYLNSIKYLFCNKENATISMIIDDLNPSIITYGDAINHVHFSAPSGIDGFTNNFIFVADTGNNRVVRLFLNQNNINFSKIKDIGLNKPNNLYICKNNSLNFKAGAILIADTSNNRIIAVDQDLEFINCFNNKTSPTFGKIGNNKSDLNFPTDVCVDNDGNIIVISKGNSRITKFNFNGDYINHVGMESLGFLNSELTALAIDKFNSIYVIDNSRNLLYKFDKNLRFICSLGGDGDEKYSLYDPRDVFIYGKYGALAISTSKGIKIFRQKPGLKIITSSNTNFSPFNMVVNEYKATYKLNSESLVNIFILDENSKIVRILDKNQWKEIGDHCIVWDGKNDLGQLVLEGIYKIKIIADVAIDIPNKNEFNPQTFDQEIYNNYFEGGFGQEIQQTITVLPSFTLLFVNSVPNALSILKNSATLDYKVSQNCSTTLSIYKSRYENGTNKPDTEIKSIAIDKQDLTGKDLFAQWNGKDFSDTDVPDGVYFWAGKIKNADSESDWQYYRIGVDRNPIKITSFNSSYAFAPKSLNPDKNKMKISFKLNEPGFVTIKIKNKAGIYIKTIADNQYFDIADSEYTLLWDGKDTKGYVIQEGEYHVEIKAVDVTGNSSDMNK